MQQASLPFSALFGWAWLGDGLNSQAWAGIATTTAGLAVLSWPRRDQLAGAGMGSVLGLASGAAFAVGLNAYRQAGLLLDPHHPIYSATASVCAAQTLQTILLVAALAIWRPASLTAVARSWRPSLGAGFFGAAASACWFGALALAPAGPVRAIGVIEAPIAAAAGRRLFKEALTTRQLAGGVLAAIGVIATALH
jgi:drug/metabolite transporter (DMT)-like permease